MAVWVPETTHSLEPAKQSSQMGLRRVCWRVWRSWGEVVVEFVDPTLRDEAAKDGAPGCLDVRRFWVVEAIGFFRSSGLGCVDRGSAVALARDAHISESRYGAPGFVGTPGFAGVLRVLLGE